MVAKGIKLYLKDSLLWLGLAIFLSGLLEPVWFAPEMLGLPVMLTDLGLYPTGNRIIINALGLIVINTVKVLPLMLGAFILEDRIYRAVRKEWLRFVLAPALVLSVGSVSLIVSSASFSKVSDNLFNGGTLIILFAMILLQKLINDRLSLGIKVLLLAEIILGVHCLDMVPGISQYVVGHDQMVIRLQEFAFLGALDGAIGLYASTLFIGIEGSAIILAILLVLETQRRKIEQSLYKAQLEAIESRTSQEVLHLVHDLKTPLTAVDGLISLIQLKSNDSKVVEYCGKIMEATRSMSNMVSEILYGQELIHCTLYEILNYLLAVCPRTPQLGSEFSQEEYLNTKILVNRIRLTRALINLIDNAYDAFNDQKNFQVVLRANDQGDEIWLGVEDNGPGITSEEIEHIWKAGYSTKGHAGVGLAFVRRVAEEHGGSVRIDSRPGLGTVVWIGIRKVFA